ncbi:hypothetical protein ACMS1W_003930 [Enterobacter hormaechei]
MAGTAHEEDSAPEWLAAQFPNIGEALPAALCEGLTANLLHLFEVMVMVIKNDEVAMFKSNNGVILAADAAYAAAEEAVKGASDDHWYRQKLIKAALETALASVIVL